MTRRVAQPLRAPAPGSMTPPSGTPLRGIFLSIFGTWYVSAASRELGVTRTFIEHVAGGRRMMPLAMMDRLDRLVIAAPARIDAWARSEHARIEEERQERKTAASGALTTLRQLRLARERYDAARKPGPAFRAVSPPFGLPIVPARVPMPEAAPAEPPKPAPRPKFSPAALATFLLLERRRERLKGRI